MGESMAIGGMEALNISSDADRKGGLEALRCVECDEVKVCLTSEMSNG